MLLKPTKLQNHPLEHQTKPTTLLHQLKWASVELRLSLLTAERASVTVFIRVDSI